MKNNNKMTYNAVSIKTGKLIAVGADFLEVNKKAIDSGIQFKMNIIPNPDLKFVF